MFTDVYLSSLNGWQWVLTHFESHVQYVSSNELVEPGVPTGELGAQGFLEMSDSKQAAEVAAFDALAGRRPPRRLVRSYRGRRAVAGATRRYSSGRRIVGVTERRWLGLRAHSSNALDTKRIEGPLVDQARTDFAEGLISYRTVSS